MNVLTRVGNDDSTVSHFLNLTSKNEGLIIAGPPPHFTHDVKVKIAIMIFHFWETSQYLTILIIRVNHNIHLQIGSVQATFKLQVRRQ